MTAPGWFTGEEFANRFDETLSDLLICPSLHPANLPQAYLLGGQSGAGKTRLHHICSNHFNGNVIVINGDEYRSSHPRYYELDEKYGPDAVTYTSEWSGRMVEELVDSLSKLKYNLVIEGTLRTSEVPLASAKLLGKRGYAVSLALMAVKPEISLLSCQIRYEEMRIAGTVPRATDPKHHRMIVENIVDNLAVLEESGAFERIELFSRSGECLYPRSFEEQTAHEALSEILFGPWTSEERMHYRFLQERLERLKSEVANK